jgi:hypothetical protein
VDTTDPESGFFYFYLRESGCCQLVHGIDEENEDRNCRQKLHQKTTAAFVSAYYAQKRSKDQLFSFIESQN